MSICYSCEIFNFHFSKNKRILLQIRKENYHCSVTVNFFAVLELYSNIAINSLTFQCITLALRQVSAGYISYYVYKWILL
jgi:hypothetical protein